MIFSLHSHIHILQLEGYSLSRFFLWWLRHPLALRSTQKKPLVWTSKARLLKFGSLLLTITLLGLFFLLFSFPGAFLALFLTLFTPISLLLAAFLIQPLERYQRSKIISESTKALESARKLQTIGITGSYGKTSVKEMLFQILREYEPTVRTPESYNTPLGIAKTISLELTSKVRYFLCEMGAYQRGEISSLTKQVPLDFAILTAIGKQHLERFGSLENTTKAKFEIVEAVQPKNALVNYDNERIRQHLADHPELSEVKTYSLDNSEATFYASHLRFSPNGMKWQFNAPQKKLLLTSPLFGTANLVNLVGAVSMATMLGVPEKIIQQALRSLKPAPHRLELKKIGVATLIDNAFSSNEAGFRLVMLDLENLPGKKVLITPGLVELGAETKAIHYHLGELAASVFDQVYLVGDSMRTKSFHQGVKSVKSDLAVEFLANDTHLWPLIAELSKEFDWILLENDLPDNY